MNIIFLLVSQSIGLLLGIIKSIFLPMYLSINDFGYWQIYLLYVGYLGVLSFGFNDGLLARYGKIDFHFLPQKVGKSIKLFMIFNLSLTLFLLLINIFIIDSNKMLVYFFIILNIPLVTLNGIFLFLLQSTNQIKKYSVYSTIDKLVLVIVITLLIILDEKNIYIIILVDTISKLIQSIIMYINLKKIFDDKIRYKDLFLNLIEIFQNIKRGILILLSNLIGMLLFGYSMFLIEKLMSITKYSMYSFSISTTNLLLLFINAVSIIVFPYISRIRDDRLTKKISDINYIINILTLMMLILYYPIVLVINLFLIQYKEVLNFLPFIFSSVILQFKYHALFIPYSKLKNKENEILYINFKVLIFILCMTSLAVIFFKSLFMTALFLFLALLLRNVMIEKKILINITYSIKNIIFELIIFVIFFITIFCLNYIISFFVYILFLITIILYKYSKIIKIYSEWRKV